jgi:putative transposase
MSWHGLVSVHFTEMLMLTDMVPSIGLYKAECVRDGSPFRDGPLTALADLEEATSAWMHWYNTARLVPARPQTTCRSRSRVLR